MVRLAQGKWRCNKTGHGASPSASADSCPSTSFLSQARFFLVALLHALPQIHQCLVEGINPEQP